MKINILKGPIQSGKTTFLEEFVLKHPNCSGILSPVIDGKRYFKNIRNNEMRCMEAMENERAILKIGRFTFSVESFAWAEEILFRSLHEKSAYLIIDEIGPLELQGKGFSNFLTQLLLQENDKEILLVIRESTVEEVIRYFNIEKSSITFLNKIKQ